MVVNAAVHPARRLIAEDSSLREANPSLSRTVTPASAPPVIVSVISSSSIATVAAEASSPAESNPILRTTFPPIASVSLINVPL